jgi:MFS family permease
MPPKFLEESGIARKDFFIILILLFNAFTCLYIMPIIIDDLLSVLNATYTQTLIIWVSYFAAIVGSSIVGAILSNKIRRLNFLYLWMILGVIISLLPTLLNNSSVMHVMAVSILLGVSSGLGMPSCLAYFADWTLVENRGRLGGIVLLITNLSAPLFAILFGMFNLIINSIILAVWRGFGLTIFFLKPEEKLVSERKKNPSFVSILHDKSFALYFIAWLMFCLIDRFETPIQENFLGGSYNLLIMFAPLLGGLSAFVGGILSDRIGRKRVLLYGFVSLGIAYAITGIVSAPLISWYLSLSVLFISAGIVWVLFILILWGDLSKLGTREKYYVIGASPFFLTNIVQLLSAEYVTLIPDTSAFSLAAFFLFLAVLPLLYAPETLPEKKIELRQLRKYVESAKEVKEKYEEKGVKG